MTTLTPQEAIGLLITKTTPRWTLDASLFITSSPSIDPLDVQHALQAGWTASASFESSVRTSLDQTTDHASVWASVRDDPELLAGLNGRAEIWRRAHRLDAWLEMVEEDDDPWAQDQDQTPAPALPFDLRTLLTAPALTVALLLTTYPHLKNLRILINHLRQELFPYRFVILDAIPDWIRPDEFAQILPRCGESGESEIEWPVGPSSSRSTKTLDGQNAPLVVPDEDDHPSSSSSRPSLCSARELSEWYRLRAEGIEANTGLVDISLAYVQHAASGSVPLLDSLGEDLSLLSRLIYDASNLPSSSFSPTPLVDEDKEPWTLNRWRSSEPEDITAAYLRYASPSTVIHLIESLLLPYLYVVVSRSERAGHPDPELPIRLIQRWLLSAPLELARKVFEASKATLPQYERVLKKDDDVARLALAILYGSRSTSSWSTMSAIFECMPAWQFGPEDHEDGEGSTTLGALGQFLKLNPSERARSASELEMFFRPLGTPGLSVLLDTLDVHLSSAETMDKWGVPAPLGDFILAGEGEQRAWATRLARRGGERANESESWEELLVDMKALRAGGEGALGRLSEQEVLEIFFGGLLSFGNFKMAKKLINARPAMLDSQTVERLVLAASVEFYENAESGNLHEGNMKLAYTCLTVVAPPTPAVIKERLLIEATSKITSYRLISLRSGLALTPLEIRLTKDKLSLVSRILSCSEDAYRHPEVILDLVDKLGLAGNPVAEVKTLGMLADAAVQSQSTDWDTAVGYVERMIVAVDGFHPTKGEEEGEEREAREVCWKTCFQFGKQSEWKDDERKRALLAQALRLCPGETIGDVLVVWKKLEQTTLDHPFVASHRERPRPPTGRKEGLFQGQLLDWSNAVDPAGHRKRDLAAQAASRTFNQLSSSLSSLRPLASSPAPSRGRGVLEGDGRRSASPSVASLFRTQGVVQAEEEILNTGRRAFTRGVGWLLGANEDEMGGSHII